jgi:hypothetical protein
MKTENFDVVQQSDVDYPLNLLNDLLRLENEILIYRDKLLSFQGSPTPHSQGTELEPKDISFPFIWVDNNN